jgi:hypothetical protein
MDSKKAKKKAKQVWEVGRTIHLGGRKYVIKGREENTLGKPWIIATEDGSRVYHWRAMHGLKLISGQELVRRRSRAEAAPAAPAVPLPQAAAGSGLLGLIVEDIQAHPRAGSGEFLVKVLAHFGVALPGTAGTPAHVLGAPSGEAPTGLVPAKAGS